MILKIPVSVFLGAFTLSKFGYIGDHLATAPMLKKKRGASNPSKHYLRCAETPAAQKPPLAEHGYYPSKPQTSRTL